MIYRFLNQKNTIKYNIEKNIINFNHDDLKNSNFDLTGSIRFLPFHFDLNINIKKINLEELENILFTIYNNKNLKQENLSGTLNLNFQELENKIMQKGFLTLNFSGSKLTLYDDNFNLGDFARLKIIDYEYLDENDELLQMKIKLIVNNQDKFNRFLFNYRKNVILSKNLYFTYQYDTNSRTSFISSISDKGFENSNELYKFNNLQQLKNLLRDDKLINSD